VQPKTQALLWRQAKPARRQKFVGSWNDPMPRFVSSSRRWSEAMLKYFEPMKFEQWRGRSIYELLGVRFFKRYLLPDQILLFRLRGKKAIQRGQGVLDTELKRLEWETRRNEVTHLLALLLTGCILAFKFPQLTTVQFHIIFVINLYINVYPIFVQRYNRFRIMGLLKSANHKAPSHDAR
jgi:hypothetical protein